MLSVADRRARLHGVARQPNLTGTTAIQAPKWKFNANLDYSPHLTTNLRGVAQVNWQYQSSLYFQARDPQTFQPAFSIVNVGLGVRDEIAAGKWWRSSTTCSTSNIMGRW